MPRVAYKEQEFGFCPLFNFAYVKQRALLCPKHCNNCFVFFTSRWTQILGVFSSKGNVKAPLLSKLLLEATILAEKSGLRVDYWTSDGAPWNRSLWKLLGIKGKLPHSVHLCKTMFFLPALA